MNHRAFTLIELLVVVAIIGILAAVGVVAYNGYTASTKRSAAKANHTTLVKYFSAELQKCNLGESKFIENYIKCEDRFGWMNISTDASYVLRGKFKNPYREGTVNHQNIPEHGSLGSSCSKNEEGETKIMHKNSILEVQTCISDTELLTDKIIIE